MNSAGDLVVQTAYSIGGGDNSLDFLNLSNCMQNFTIAVLMPHLSNRSIQSLFFILGIEI